MKSTANPVTTLAGNVPDLLEEIVPYVSPMRTSGLAQVSNVSATMASTNRQMVTHAGHVTQVA